MILAIAHVPVVWNMAPPEGKCILVLLFFFSIFAWSIMASKGVQMRRARKLNGYFELEFKRQQHVLEIFQRHVDVEGCPKFSVYEQSGKALSEMVRRSERNEGRRAVTLKGMEQIKRILERTVAEESLKLESGLILLAIAVSGAPFLGLLGTVWGVMITFTDVAVRGRADLLTMAPGMAGALITTVGGLLVAIPSMFGYNWLVHHLRVLTVELDNFAQELVSRMETEFLQDEKTDINPS